MITPARDRSIGDYLSQLASSDPTPGGGSVAGILGALAMALGQMVVAKSDASAALAAASADLRAALDAAIAGSDADEAAYGSYIAATKLPRATAEDKAARTAALQAGLRAAAEAPLRLAELISAKTETLETVAVQGNPHLVSDAQIALLIAATALEACLINVRANLPYIKDHEIVAALELRIAAIRLPASE